MSHLQITFEIVTSKAIDGPDKLHVWGRRHIHAGIWWEHLKKIDFSCPSLFAGITFQEPLLKVKIYKLTVPCHPPKNNGFLFDSVFLLFAITL